jgi:translation initiation factor IF-3
LRPGRGPGGTRIADRRVTERIRINERIRAREIRVVDDEGKQLGIMAPYEAIKIARERGLDLVEVSPTANPPVCRIINYGKYLYQQSKREHEARKHQRSIELKEVKFRPRTGAHDFDTKRNQIAGFLEEGSKVKATVMFRGREMAHRNLGWEMMDRLVKDLGDLVVVEIRPRQEGPNLTTILAPKKPGQPTKPKPAPPQAAQASATSGTGSHSAGAAPAGHQGAPAAGAPRPGGAQFVARPAVPSAHPAGDPVKPPGQ